MIGLLQLSETLLLVPSVPDTALDFIRARCDVAVGPSVPDMLTDLIEFVETRLDLQELDETLLLVRLHRSVTERASVFRRLWRRCRWPVCQTCPLHASLIPLNFVNVDVIFHIEKRNLVEHAMFSWSLPQPLSVGTHGIRRQPGAGYRESTPTISSNWPPTADEYANSVSEIARSWEQSPAYGKH